MKAETYLVRCNKKTKPFLMQVYINPLINCPKEFEYVTNIFLDNGVLEARYRFKTAGITLRVKPPYESTQVVFSGRLADKSRAKSKLVQLVGKNNLLAA